MAPRDDRTNRGRQSQMISPAQLRAAEAEQTRRAATRAELAPSAAAAARAVAAQRTTPTTTPAPRPSAGNAAAPRPAAGGAPAGLSPELAAANAQYGVSVTPGGGIVSADDPNIYWGTHDSRGRQRRTNPYLLRSQVLVEPAKWKPEDLDAFQRRMFAAGLFGAMKESEVPWGTFDPYTQTAWKHLVDTSQAYTAAGQKVSPQDVLGRLPAIGGGGAGRAPFSAAVSNPAELRRGLRAAAKEILGSAVPDDQLDRMIAAYQAEQVRAQRGAYDSAESGGTTTAAMDFATFAETEVRKVDPVKADSRGAVKVAGVIARMLAGDMPSEGAL